MLNLIVAPKCECANAESIAKRVVKFLKAEKIEYSVYFSNSLKDIKNSIDELISFGEQEYVVIGCCSVVNEVVNSFKDLAKIKIGIIPTSRRDDFARFLNLEVNPILAIKNILAKKVSEIDYLLVNNKRVVNNVVIGASVEIFELQSQLNMKNFVTETICENKMQKEYSGTNITIQQKTGKAKSVNVYEFVVANGGYSHGKLISPLSNVKDGLFNVVYTEQTGEKTDFKNLQKFNSGDHIYLEDVVQQWINNLKIGNPENKIKAIVDGRIETFDNLEISIVENGLKLYGVEK